MAENSIEVSNLGKKYIIRHQQEKRSHNYTTLRDILADGAGRLVARSRDRNAEPLPPKEEFWALRGVSFDVKRGECVGIIGRNGAGKSTLLKLLSRITEPTEGRIHLRGRVASLLEVATGFHPELTGRENIFLNGAILGMKRSEIKAKFDDIVAFAEVERFLDTPVKRYSSGMYVRLAFSVASHLEPEILLVDEVLAVGDLAFQKKCLGRMKDVSSQDRTVFFVSHNMAAIAGLCQRAILLDQGNVEEDGPANHVVQTYFSGSGVWSGAEYRVPTDGVAPGNAEARLVSARVIDPKGNTRATFSIDEDVAIEMVYRLDVDSQDIYVPNFHFYSAGGQCVFAINAPDITPMKSGTYRVRCHIPAHFLNDTAYFVGVALTRYRNEKTDICFFEQNALNFVMTEDIHLNPDRYGYGGTVPGVLRPKLNWEIEST